MSTVLVALPPLPNGATALPKIPEAAARIGEEVPDGEQILFGTTPVHIHEANTPLAEAALQTALAAKFDGAPTRVLAAEHLYATALALQ